MAFLFKKKNYQEPYVIFWQKIIRMLVTFNRGEKVTICYIFIS